jgi:hypothetical protein
LLLCDGEQYGVSGSVCSLNAAVVELQAARSSVANQLTVVYRFVF